MEKLEELTLMSEEDGIEYLNENLKPNGSDPLSSWIDEKVPNPNPNGDEEVIARGDALNDIQSYIDKQINGNNE